MNESFKRQFPSASAPLPTHHPLQLLHWKDQDRQHNTWYLEKYNRLQDSRKQPLSVDCSLDDRLVIQFKEQVNKMICIYHNYRELETFCIHPLLFSHDLISKETRLLFCIKDQVENYIDGSIRYKFRVKFISQDEVISFCSAVAGYVTIKSYEEWSRQSEGSKTPTFSERGRTPLSEKGNITLLDKTFESTIINETDASENVSGNHPESQENKNGENLSNTVVNVNIENLISVEAMREFGKVLFHLVGIIQDKSKEKKPMSTTTVSNDSSYFACEKKS
ncbi:hypothetical protein Mgra_00000173 [Meloidogyne graminicola]|uniref:Uncharacterized protein n=1 Tax=Meloidogyne graminicola TaxID=189291 RepID=A0A8T0A2K6_9BILA|nr:hypothetical protein Mgra_00000173 [Meloidogyne graminicola]